ncbi:uncharacterized protein LOC134196358 [Corticium candelabrum]|uniref:uncharacterized protein LOC134196358 n=1 Tax=Corticium candelabrum TaxID=121492 RepID=UPI002E2748A6|nr:uncharacterized protein LOC134196358 [Corticium candelabrum]
MSGNDTVCDDLEKQTEQGRLLQERKEYHVFLVALKAKHDEAWTRQSKIDDCLDGLVSTHMDSEMLDQRTLLLREQQTLKYAIDELTNKISEVRRRRNEIDERIIRFQSEDEMINMSPRLNFWNSFTYSRDVEMKCQAEEVARQREYEKAREQKLANKKQLAGHLDDLLEIERQNEGQSQSHAQHTGDWKQSKEISNTAAVARVVVCGQLRSMGNVQETSGELTLPSSSLLSPYVCSSAVKQLKTQASIQEKSSAVARPEQTSGEQTSKIHEEKIQVLDGRCGNIEKMVGGLIARVEHLESCDKVVSSHKQLIVNDEDHKCTTRKDSTTEIGMLQRDLNSNTSGLCSSASLECKKSLEEGTDFDLSLLQQEKVLSAESTNAFQCKDTSRCPETLAKCAESGGEASQPTVTLKGGTPTA